MTDQSEPPDDRRSPRTPDRSATVLPFSPRAKPDESTDRSAADAADGDILTLQDSDQLADETDPVDPVDSEPGDWAWVEEWRAGREPLPWASGLALAAFSALLVGVAVWVLSAGLAARPVLAVGVNLLVAGGLAPAMWLSRGLPVLRWIALGSAVGVLAGWVCALMMLPLPAP